MKLRPEPILIGLACLGPFALALAMYFGPLDKSALPAIENSERELIARGTLPSLALHTADGAAAAEPWASYRWSLVYVAATPCTGTCRAALERLGQVHDALGKDRHRVRRVLLVFGGEAPAAPDPALLVGRLDADRRALWRKLFGPEPERSRVFVVDPLGNLVAAYPADANRKALLEDLERLLDVSRIG